MKCFTSMFSSVKSCKRRQCERHPSEEEAEKDASESSRLLREQCEQSVTHTIDVLGGAEILAGVQGLGEACSICGSDRIATHCAMPCLHACCRSCWETWMATSTRCMVCSAPVQEVIRAPTAQVPLTLFERAETNTQEHWAAIFLQSCRVEDHASVFVEKLVLLRSTFEATSEALSSSVAHIEASSADDRACNMEVATGVFAEQLRILMALLEGDFAMMQSALQSLRAEAPGLVESVRDNTAAGGRQEDEAAARPVEVKAAAETEGTATFSCSPESALTIFEVITPDPPGLSAEMEEAEQRVRDAVHALITTQKVWRALWVSLTLCMEVVSEEKFPAALCALNDGAADSRPEILHAAMVMSGLQSTLKARSTTLGGILEELDAEVDLLRKSFQGPDSLLPSDAKEEQEASLVEQEASLVPRLPGPRGVIAL